MPFGRLRGKIMATTSTTATPQGYKLIKFEIIREVAHITLNHPDKNVLTNTLMSEVADAIESLNGRGDVKGILLDSSQKAFSYGISLEDSRPDRVFQTLDAFNRVFQ